MILFMPLGSREAKKQDEVAEGQILLLFRILAGLLAVLARKV